MILRVCYDTEGKGMEREPQRIFVVQRHMQALGSLAERYADAILTVQGVFVGSWGEMHTLSLIHILNPPGCPDIFRIFSQSIRL